MQTLTLTIQTSPAIKFMNNWTEEEEQDFCCKCAVF